MRPETEKVGCECQKVSHGRVDGGHSMASSQPACRHVAEASCDLSVATPALASLPSRRGVARPDRHPVSISAQCQPLSEAPAACLPTPGRHRHPHAKHQHFTRRPRTGEVHSVQPSVPGLAGLNLHDIKQNQWMDGYSFVLVRHKLGTSVRNNLVDLSIHRSFMHVHASSYYE